MEMSFFKLARFTLFFLLVFGLYEVGFSQECDGVGGAGISGGAVSTNLGFLCANVDAAGGPSSGAVIRITAGNVIDGDVVTFIVNWDDGFLTPPLLANKMGPNDWELNGVTHYFPTTGPEVKCRYIPRVSLFINGNLCTTDFGTPPVFTRWNVDNENTGVLRLEETATSVNTYPVCRGTETTVTFTDRSTLNCVPPDHALPPLNTLQRWRRFTYGTPNGITSATGVEVNGVIELYPFRGTVISAPTPIQNPLPPAVSLPITIPADAQVGEEFVITMEYWNTCNPYDDPLIPGPPADLINGDNAPVTETARILVVEEPPPPSANNNNVCNASPLPNFSINTPGFPAPIVTWFQDNANAPGAVIPGFTTSTLPASAIGVNNTIAGTYRVWASYFGVNNPQVISCESARIPVTLTIRENLPIIPAPFPGYSNQICRDDPMTITLPNPATETFGGPTEYGWSVTSGGGVTFTQTANSATFNFSGVTFGAGVTFVDRNIRIVRRYTTGLTCQSPNRDLPVRIFAPSVGGTLSAVPDICETSPVGTINLTGHRGTVQRWEVSFNGGPFLPNAALGTGTSISPGTVPFGNYQYRAIVANGTCAEVPSSIEELDVFPNPDGASVGARQEFCELALNSNPLGGNTPAVGTGVWSVFSRPAASTATAANFNNAAQGNTIFSGDAYGIYVLRWTITSGICVSTADIEVDFGTLPGPQDAGVAGPFCGLSGALNAAAPPTVGVGEWYLAPVPQPGTAVFADVLDRTSDVTVSAYGDYTFRWTVTSGICAPSPDDVVVQFREIPTASVGAPFTTCMDPLTLAPIGVSGTVGGGIGAGQRGRWEVVTGGGTLQSSGAAIGSAIVGAAINDSYIPVVGDVGDIELRLVAIDDHTGDPCGDVNSDILTITLDRKPADANAGPNQPICEDNTTLAAVAVNNGGEGTWSTATAGVTFGDPNVHNTTVSGLPIGPTTLTWTVSSALTGTAGACANTTSDVIITRNPLPDALDPAPQLCELVESSAVRPNVDLTTFNAGVTGIAGSVDRTVQWFSNVPRSPATLIADPTNYSVANATILYTTVTTISTNCTANGVVVFTVNPLPIANDLFPEICEELPVGSNNVDGVDLTSYDEQVYGIGQTDRALTWFTDATYTTPVPDATNVDGVAINDQFFARVRNTITDCENEATITFTVNPRPGVNPITGPAKVCVDPDGVVLYQVTNVNAGATYLWNIPQGPGEFVQFAGGTVNDFFVLINFPNEVLAPGLDISVTEISADGCAGVTETFNITVESIPPVSVITGPASVCSNDAGVVYSVDPLANTTFAWTVPLGASIIGGQGSHSITVNFGSISGNVSVVPTTTTGCAGNPATQAVIVNERPILEPLLNNTNCSKEASGITFDVTATSVAATTYNITAVSVDAGLIPIVGATMGNGLLADAIVLDAFENRTGGPLNVRYTVVPVSADGCEGAPRIVTLTVRPEPVLDPNLGVTICSQQQTGIVLAVATGSFPADQFEIVSINNNGLTSTMGNPTIGIFGPTEIADDAWLNNGLVPVTVTYTIRPRNSTTGCIGDPPQAVNVIVNPEPIVTPASETICSGFSPTLILQSSLPNSTFTWTVKSVSGIAIGASSGTGNMITDVLVNNSGANGTVTYEVIARGSVANGQCASEPVDVVITVEPAPTVVNQTQTVCSDLAGGSTSVTDLVSLQPAINSDGGVTFTWFQDAALTTPIPVANVTAYPMANGIPVFVRVFNGTCNSVASVNFTVNPLPSVTASATQFNGFEISCNGANNGRITAVASQGTPPYLYSIDGGANFFPTAVFNSLPPNPGYVITVRDSRGCIVNSAPIEIAEPPILEISSTVISPPACRNTSTGSVRVIAEGGITGTYTYSINGSPFQATDLFSNLLAGSYTVTVRDANNCTVSSTVTVVDPPLLGGSVTGQINVDCNSNNTGSVTVEGNGGVAPYSYALDGVNFQLSGTFTSLPAGFYTVTVRDFNNCIAPVSVNITQPGVLVLNLSSKTDVLCNGESTGAITVAGAGGTAPYEYAIDGTTFQTSGEFTGLAFGPQTLTVRDANLCVATLNVTINQPNPITGTITSQTNVDCFGNSTGTVTVNGSGGTGTYQFAIDGGVFGGSPTFTGLAAGPYVVTIRDQNNCSTDVPVTITQPTALGGSVVNSSNVLCAGGNSGTVEVLGTGGTSPYQYSINGGGLFTSNPSFTGLTAGLYTVIVRDNNLCTVDVDFTISQPTPLVAAINSQTAVDCRNNATGSVTVGATGGNVPYAFSIDGSNFQATGLFNGLAAGNYIVRVRDANSCTQNVNVTITEPPQLLLALQSRTNVDCNGNSTGTITVNATGGVGGYTYSRDGVTFVGSPTFTGFAAGTHTLFTRDANGCPAQVDVVITEPLMLELSVASQNDVLCNGQSTGSITVEATGGAGSYEYSRDGTIFTPLNVFFGLPAGNYTITVRDGNGCLDNVVVDIAQPGALTASATETASILCHLGADAELTVSTSGGVAPLNYLLLEDPANASGATTGVFAGMRAGTYTIRVTDANGCSVVTAPVTVSQPTQLQITTQITSNYNGFALSCAGASDASIAAVATGGTGVYTYTLLNPGIVASNATGVFDLLPAGNYRVQVQDANNCLTLSLPVLIFDPFPFSAGFVGFNQAICQGDNPALIQELVPPFGGIGNYQYQWQESLDGVRFTDVLGAMSATFTPPVALAQTTFYRRVVGSGTCTELESNIVQITVNPLPTVAFTAPAEVCEGDFFLLEFNFTGSPPFRFDYTDGINVFNNNVGNFYTPVPVFNFANTTTYTLTRVVDINGCTIFPNESVTVNVSLIDPNFTIVGPAAQCSGSTFTFQWTVYPDVEYTWIFGDGSQEVIAPNTLPVGTNTIDHIFTSLVPSTSINFPVIMRATNLANGCGPKQSNQAITVFPSIAVNVLPSDNSICSGETINFNNLTQGASAHRWFYRELGNVGQELDVRTTQFVDYTFTNNTTQNPITYEVVYVGSNANGCSDGITFPIEVYRGITASFDEGIVPEFIGGFANVTFTNTSVPLDVGAFDYAWSFGVDATPATNNGAGPFTVTYSSQGPKTITLEVTNIAAQAAGENCVSTETKTINLLLPPLTASFRAIPLKACFPTTIEVVQNTSTGDIFQWQVLDNGGKLVATSNAPLPEFRIVNPGTYDIFLQTTNSITGQSAFAQQNGIVIYDQPQAAFEVRPTTFFVPDTEITTFNFTNGASQYDWDFGDGGTSMDFEPKYVYSLEGKYEIVLVAGFDHGNHDVDGDGILDGNIICYDTARREVVGREGGLTKIPNAFTPNPNGPSGGIPGNGTFNDVFLPITRGVEEFEMQIYDRWGNMIFESRDKNQGWDGYDRNGRLLPAGVYVFKMVLRLSDGQRTTQIGDVTLIR